MRKGIWPVANCTPTVRADILFLLFDFNFLFLESLAVFRTKLCHSLRAELCGWHGNNFDIGVNLDPSPCEYCALFGTSHDVHVFSQSSLHAKLHKERHP